MDETREERSVVIMAGGTGGHVFPALAVADELRRRGIAVHWLGTHRGIEARLVPAAGIPIAYLAVAGLRGKGALAWVKAPLMLVRTVAQAWHFLRATRPVSVLGMGGFVAGPGGIAAWLLGKPLVIQEQNAIAGTTNRLLACFARRICEGFEGTFAAGARVVSTGNPVRREIAGLDSPQARGVARRGPVRLLVLGGSLGARVLNETVPAAIGLINEAIEVRHQCGDGNSAAVGAAYQQCQKAALVDDFVNDMSEAYGWADIVVCRAGALTVSELAAAGVGAILVPLPHAIDDHQTANARWLADHGAAVLLVQHDLDAERLAAEIERLCGDRGALAEMAAHARALARPQAAAQVADICLEVADG